MKFFRAIWAACKWVTADNERLRRAKAGLDPRIEPPREKPRKTGPECHDPWEEIDRHRGNMWLGKWLNDRLHKN